MARQSETLKPGLSDRGFAWIGLLVGAVVSAIPAIIIPNANSLFSFRESPLPWWIILTGLAGAGWGFVRPEGVWRWGLYIGMGLPVFLMARVLYDWFADPTSHNLFPFELAGGLLIGLPSALLGAYIGLLVKQLVQPAAHRPPE